MACTELEGIEEESSFVPWWSVNAIERGRYVVLLAYFDLSVSQAFFLSLSLSLKKAKWLNLAGQQKQQQKA